MTDETKPIVEMDDLERRRMWDDVGADIREAILQSGREGGVPLRIAAVVLYLPDDSERIIHFNPEHGDNEGWAHVREFVREIRRTGSLKAGERVEAVEYEVRPTRRLR